MGNLNRCRGPLPSPFRIQKSDFSDRQRARQDNFTSHGLNTSRVFRIFSHVERPTRKLPDFGRRLSRIFAGFPPRPRNVSRKARAGFCRILPLPGKHKPDFLRHLPGNAGFREKIREPALLGQTVLYHPARWLCESTTWRPSDFVFNGLRPLI